MLRTQTPLARWWKSLKHKMARVIALTMLIVAPTSVAYCLHTLKKDEKLDNLALLTASKFNASVTMKVAPSRSRSSLDVHTKVHPWMMDCEGDEVNLSMLYDKERHTWIDLIGEVKHTKSRPALLQKESDAVHASLLVLKETGMLAQNCKVRVTNTRHFLIPKRWRVNWEVQTPNEPTYKITTMIDDTKGLPIHIHNCKY